MRAQEWKVRVIDSLTSSPTSILRRLVLTWPDPRSQRGELADSVPNRGKLARGRYWARWRIYFFPTADGRDKSRRAERIIDRVVAEQMGFMLEYGWTPEQIRPLARCSKN